MLAMVPLTTVTNMENLLSMGLLAPSDSAYQMVRDLNGLSQSCLPLESASLMGATLPKECQKREC